MARQSSKHRQPHGSAHQWLLQKESQLRDSFRKSFKESKEEVQEARRTLYAVLLFFGTRLVFPILQPWDFVCLVRKLFIVGWQKGFSSFVLSVLREIDAPLKDFGAWVEEKAFQCFGGYDVMAGPDRKLSIIGVLDKNVQLQSQTVDLFPSPTPSSRPNADVCVMAAKIVYESEEVVTDTINNVWNTQVIEGGRIKGRSPPTERFEFVKWFKYDKKDADHSVETQAMLFKKGSAYVVAFRGTEPFSAVDWATDFYFPWYEFPALGRVHTGFLQSLGLGYPKDDDPPMGRRKAVVPRSGEQGKAAQAQVAAAKQAEHEKLEAFVQYIQASLARFDEAAERSMLDGEVSEEKQQRREERKRREELTHTRQKTHADAKNEFKRRYVLERKDEAPLYWQIREELKEKLKADPKGTLFVTGHSLGGALAALFTALMAAENDFIAQRIGALYTFGQPRVGDWTFAWFLHNRLNVPRHRYIRMVYTNDLVPHVPFDSDVFEFKHLGPFHRADALYHVRIGTFDEQPPINFFRAHVTATFELWYNVVWNEFANRVFRPAEFKRPTESIPQLLARLSSLFLPAIGAHSPVNYVNAVRHGMPEGKTKKAPANMA